MFKSIKTKILVLQIGFILTMAIVLGLVTYFIMFRSLKNSQLQYLESMAMHIDEKVDIAITYKKQILEKIADSEAVTNYSKKQQETVLIGYFNKFMPEFKSLSYINDKDVEEVKLGGSGEEKILNSGINLLK